jgi:hypothetical protein
LRLAALLLAPATAVCAQAAEPTAAPMPLAADPQRPVEYGAIAFTSDGSFSTAWKQAGKPQAEAKVLANCLKFNRGKCQVVSFRAEVCAALASFELSNGRKVTYSGGGVTPQDAERVVLERCNLDWRARKSCKKRTVVCGDGRAKGE